MAIQQIWFYPPLAIARLGGSETPLECFYWGEDDNLPRGTGKTTILPGRTLLVESNGTLSSYLPKQITFKDAGHFRPVCPFFELHGIWSKDGKALEGPITEALLSEHHLTLGDLKWQISVANLKPFNMTQDVGTRIDANVEIRGDDTSSWKLEGRSPANSINPLVPPDKFVPLGCVQVLKSNAGFPGVRIRFTPGRGEFFGPTDLNERWPAVHLEERFLFLNKDSSWCHFTPSPDDARGTPGGQYAQEDSGTSFGMVDDVCDGIISCTIPVSGELPLIAKARIAVAPPDYAPDRRHLISLADGLKDRVDREAVLSDDYFENEALCDAEVRELMQRIYETASLNNVDVFNQRVNIQENPETAIQLGIPFRPLEYVAFPPRGSIEKRPLPLSDSAVEHHRRFQVMAVFLDMIRKQPELLKQLTREPLDRELFFDHRMPAVMRGASGDPLTLTRRQYDFLLKWAARKSAIPQ